jgi:hypothetical protein
MRESRTYGFVRGARGNSRPYRVPLLAHSSPGLMHSHVRSRRKLTLEREALLCTPKSNTTRGLQLDF